MYKGFPSGSVVKNLPVKAGNMGLILGLGRSPEGGNGNLLQYSCFENSMGSQRIEHNWATEHTQKQTQNNTANRVPIFATLWTVAYQAPQSMEFFRQEYWSGLPFPSPGDLSNPGIEPGSPALQADALPSEPPGKPSRIIHTNNYHKCKWAKSSNQKTHTG